MESDKRVTEQGAIVWLTGLSPGVLEVRRAGFDQQLGGDRLMFNARVAIERYLALQAKAGASAGNSAA